MAACECRNAGPGRSMRRMACIGECMIELSEAAEGSSASVMQRTCGGDTLKTAVYLSRCLKQAQDLNPTGDGAAAQVHYVTALGDDPFSAEMLAAWRRAGLQTGLVCRLPGRLPGLSLIRPDPAGGRSFP